MYSTYIERERDVRSCLVCAVEMVDFSLNREAIVLFAVLNYYALI